MKKYLIIIWFSFLLSFIAYTQVPEIVWQQCYGGSENDEATDIVEIQDGYLIAGNTLSENGDISNNHGSFDIWLIKTDYMGNIVWEKTYGGTKGEGCRRIIPNGNGDYYLLGGSNSSDGDISNDLYTDSWDFWILKIDNEGTIIWDRIVGGNADETLWTGTLTDDGGVLAMGWTASNDGDVSMHYGNFDSWMVKLNGDGEIEWDFTVGTDWFEYGQAIIQTSDGGYLMGSSCATGEGGNITCEPHSNGYADGVLFKLDADRNVEWQHCYGGSKHDGITALLEVNDGYVFGAYAGSNDGDISGWHGEDDIWIVKIDYFGNIIWQNPLGGSRSEFISKLLITEDENIIIPGFTQSNNGDVSGNHTLSQYDYDIWMVQLNNDGELISQQCFGGEGSETVNFGIIKKNDNNFVIVGQTDYGPSYDVACTPHGGNYDRDFWLFEIKDCSQYPVGNIGAISGPDTVCTVYDSTNLYAIDPVTGAWYYRWYLSPEEAGTININGPEATVNWDLGWEGTANIVVRAMNDCDTTEWTELHHTEVFTCLGLEELMVGGVGMKVYPNPAKDHVIFEIPVTLIKNNNPNNKPAVIPNPGAGQGAGERNPHTGLDPADKSQGNSDGRNTKGVSHARAQGQAQGLEMTVVVVDVYGQGVAELPVTSEKTVWDTDKVKDGIYFYRVEVDGEVLSGKVVVQK